MNKPNSIKLVIFVVLFAQISTVEKCDIYGGQEIITFDGQSNDGEEFDFKVFQKSTHQELSLAVWFKVTAYPSTAVKGIIARYHNKIKIYVEDDGTNQEVKVWAQDATPGDKLLGRAPVALTTWTLVWLEISGTDTYFILRDQSSGQTSSEAKTLNSKKIGF